MKNIYDYFLKNEAKILANHMRTEGSTVSINDTKKLISTKAENKVMEEALGVTPTDFNMFYNLEDGWSYVFEIGQQDIDLELITRINSKVSDETNAFPGIIRTKQSIFVPTQKDTYIPDIPMPQVIEQELNDINSIEDPIQKSMELFTFIARSQMFENCNKRTAYLVANVVLVQNDIALLTPVDELNTTFLNILSNYYLDPTDANKNKVHRFLKENFLFNQELDYKRQEQGYHMIYEDDVDSILAERSNCLSQIKDVDVEDQDIEM